MKRRIFCMLVVLLLIFVVIQPVFASVEVVGDFDDECVGVEVVGNPNFYPIEYYNAQTGRFEGVMPEILEDISERTGIDFVYVYDGKSSQSALAQNNKTDMVSSFMTDSDEEYAAEKITVLSYRHSGKLVNVGLAFTSNADAQTVNKITAEIERLTEQEINGYLVEASHNVRGESDKDGYIILLLCLALIVVFALAVFNFKKLKERLNENKMSDSETGIANIAYFEQYFGCMIPDGERSRHYVAYFIIDSNYLQIYHSKTIFADAVKYVAGVLKSHEKPNELAARITENGFAFVFCAENSDMASKRIQLINEKMNMYIQDDSRSERPFYHVALYNLNNSDTNSEMLLFNLRKNCSKLMGTEQQTVLVDEVMMNKDAEEKQLLESIMQGFENREFKLNLQFIVAAKTRRIVSAEALSRWVNPEKGIILPGKYISVLESSGMITKLDYYMFELVCRQLHKWRNTEFDAVTVSCNFTRITISEDDFADNIREISERYVFEKRKLIIEITEDAIEKNRDVAMSNISKCKKMGFRIALDDMGSGYTSLINLCEYPIDIVKIDRDILLKTDKPNGRALFAGIVALAHSLGLSVVCEGVETEEQNSLVESTDCDYIQGWYYSRALPDSEAEKFAREYVEKLSDK